MTETALYDVAIIGGGLAGLCLSIQVAEAGFKVILFEKEHYPFHKVCGEYISLESWDFLIQRGVPLQKFDLPVMTKFQTSDVTGRLYNFKLPQGGFGISRYKLDHSLYNIAVEKGVEVMADTKIMATRQNKNQFILEGVSNTYNAKVVAGSFGKRSNLDIKWARPFTVKNSSLSNYLGVKYHIRFPHPHDTIALHNFKNGYCGISKIEEDISCLCYLTTAANLKNNGNSILQMEEEVLHKNPILKKIFTTATFLYHKPLTISQVSFAPKNQVENHVLMLGDAAGMITPLCGNGMSMAMHGSKLAFLSIQKYLNNQLTREEMEQEYILAWQNQFEKRLKIGRMVQSLFGGNLTTSLFFKTMEKVPMLAKAVIRSTHGKPF